MNRLLRVFHRFPLNVPIHHVLREGSVLSGDLTFSGGLMVLGAVTGRLIPQGKGSAVAVGRTAQVHTSVLQADTVVIQGQVRAERIVARRVVFAASAQVDAHVEAHEVDIHAGARLEGQLRVLGKAAPSPPPEGSAAVAKSRLTPPRPEAG